MQWIMLFPRGQKHREVHFFPFRNHTVCLCALLSLKTVVINVLFLLLAYSFPSAGLGSQLHGLLGEGNFVGWVSTTKILADFSS